MIVWGRVMFILIMLLVILPPLAIDEYAPSMPAMVGSLHSSMTVIQLSIAVYLFAQGLSQLISGPLSDRYGRKNPLLITLIIYLVGSIFCAITSNDTWLLIGRFIQGIGMGCCAITAPSLIGDCYSGEKFKRVSSYVVIIYSFVPIVAPVLGGHFQEWFGWRSNFFLLILIPLIVLILVSLFLPETHAPTNEHNLNVSQLIKNYKKVLSSPVYVGFVITMAFLWSIIMVFSVIAPFILQKEMGVSASQYGHLAFFVGLSFLLGNMFSRVCTHLVGEDKIVITTLGLQLGVAVLMLIAAVIFSMSTWLLVIPATIIIFTNGIVFPKLYSHALSIFTNLMGIASSLVGAIMLFGSVIITSIIANLNIHSIFGAALIYSVLSCLSVLTFLTTRKVEISKKLI